MKQQPKLMTYENPTGYIGTKQKIEPLLYNTEHLNYRAEEDFTSTNKININDASSIKGIEPMLPIISDF